MKLHMACPSFSTVTHHTYEADICVPDLSGGSLQATLSRDE